MKKIVFFAFFLILNAYDCNNPYLIEKLNNTLKATSFNFFQKKNFIIYSFNTKIKGKVNIDLKSNTDFSIKVSKNSCGNDNWITNKYVKLNIDVNPDDKVFIFIKKRKYNIKGTIKFNPNIIEDTHDICYRQKKENGLICFKNPFGIPISGGILCKNSYDIDVYGNLEDVIIDHTDPTLFQGNAFKDCGIDPESDDKSCKIANRVDLWKFGFLDKSLEYNLSNLNSNDNLSIWAKTLLNLELFSSGQTYVRYIKNGYLHIGRLNQCDDYTNANFLKFRKVFNKKINGRMIVIGNTNVCKTDYNGKCINPSKKDINDNINLQYVKIDNISDVSYSSLKLNDEDKIIWAGLYWQGRIKTENPNYSDKVKKARFVELKTPANNQYYDIEAKYDNFNWYYSDKYNIFDYAGFANITDLVKNGGSGKYFLKNLQISTGKDVSGGWSIVVVVKNRNDSFKKIVVYQGFEPLWKKKGFSDKLTLKIKGFKVKSEGKIDSNLIFFANETDVGMGDSVSINDKKINNDINPTKDIMNSTISIKGENVINRYPNFKNNLGIDIDKFDLSKMIKNSSSKIKIKFKTYKDRYLLSMIGFSVELDIPKICYYDKKIYDENNKLIDMKNLQKGKKYTVEYKIKNGENFSVRNFYVLNLFKNQSYIRNSTFVKNADQNSLKHIDDNSSNGNIKVKYSNGVLKIGRIKDKKNILTPFKKENYAIIKYKELALINSKADSLIYGDYYFTNANYSGILPKCKNEKPDSGKIIGNFDAFDSDESITHRVIKTKIAGKPFTLKIMFIAPQNMINDANGTNIYYQLYDMDSNTPVTNFESFDIGHTMISKIFNIDKVYKKVTVRFKICKNLANPQIVYPSTFCNTHKPGYEFQYSYSSNNFAIRPYKFILNLPSVTVADKDFNMSIKAVDFHNDIVSNYNETLSFVTSPKLEYNETKPGCHRGNLVLSSLSFHNGKLVTNARYSDIGNVMIKILETQGSEFAKTDASDTPWINRKIISDTKILHVKPFKFLITASLHNYNNENFTYISNDLNMSAQLNVNIQAVGYNNTHIYNYTKNCYARNTILKLIYDNHQPIRKLFIQTQSYPSRNIDTILGFINQPLSKNIFVNNSTANLNIKINFEKNYKKPTGEFNFTLNKIEAEDNEINGSLISVPGFAHFVYGYFRAYDISSYPKILGNSYQLDFNYKIFYYKNNKGWVLNKKHNFSVYGSVNISKSFGKNIFIQQNIVNNGILKMKFTTTHNIPFRSKVHLSIPSWLWYHPLAKDYQDPSILNHNCLTHPCFDVSFLNDSSEWGGISNESNKYKNNNRTGKIAPSFKNIHTNKNTLKKLNW